MLPPVQVERLFEKFIAGADSQGASMPAHAAKSP